MNTLALAGHSSLVSGQSTMTIDAAGMPARAAHGLDELVLRLRAGEVAAVGDAYDRYHESVRRFARRLVGDDATAEDMVHEVFLRLPKLIASYRGEAALGSYLISVAVHLSKHHIRAAVRRRRTAENAGIERAHLQQDGASPDRDLERRQLANLLTRALDELSHDHRTTFVLAEVEGKTSREIAAILEIPEGTVRTRLLHAKRNLRAFLEKERA